MRFLIFIGCFGLGFLLIRYSKWVVDQSGLRFQFFENNLGPGSTYGILKLLGVASIIFGFYVLFGGLGL